MSMAGTVLLSCFTGAGQSRIISWCLNGCSEPAPNLDPRGVVFNMTRMPPVDQATFASRFISERQTKSLQRLNERVSFALNELAFLLRGATAFEAGIALSALLSTAVRKDFAFSV